MKMVSGRGLTILVSMIAIAGTACSDLQKRATTMSEQPILIGTVEGLKPLPEDEARAMSEALSKALADPQTISDIQAPEPLKAQLDGSVGPFDYSSDSQRATAGAWLLSMDSGRWYWEYRPVDPDPPQIGILFRAYLSEEDKRWIVSAIKMHRIR